MLYNAIQGSTGSGSSSGHQNTSLKTNGPGGVAHDLVENHDCLYKVITHLLVCILTPGCSKSIYNFFISVLP